MLSQLVDVQRRLLPSSGNRGLRAAHAHWAALTAAASVLLATLGSVGTFVTPSGEGGAGPCGSNLHFPSRDGVQPSPWPGVGRPPGTGPLSLGHFELSVLSALSTPVFYLDFQRTKAFSPFTETRWSLWLTQNSRVSLVSFSMTTCAARIHPTALEGQCHISTLEATAARAPGGLGPLPSAGPLSCGIPPQMA